MSKWIFPGGTNKRRENGRGHQSNMRICIFVTACDFAGERGAEIF